MARQVFAVCSAFLPHKGPSVLGQKLFRGVGLQLPKRLVLALRPCPAPRRVLVRNYHLPKLDSGVWSPRQPLRDSGLAGGVVGRWKGPAASPSVSFLGITAPASPGGKGDEGRQRG